MVIKLKYLNVIDKKIKVLIGADKINKFYLIVLFTILIALVKTSGIGMIIPLIQIILNQGAHR